MEPAGQRTISAGVGYDGLNVVLLGGFSVVVEGRPIPSNAWRLRKAGHLVKLLALAPQHRMHREQVLDTLWPHLDPDAAGNNLRVTLHFARKLLDPTQNGTRALQVAGDHLVLLPDGPVVVDVERFETLAEAALGTNDLTAHTAALDLYAGELLPEDRFEEWAIERREALQAIQISLLRDMARLHEQAGDLSRAIETLRSALVGDPTAEPVHVSLMHLYARTKRRAHALRQYQQLRETLLRELDIEPEPTTTRLYEAIMTGAAGVDLPTVTTGSTHAATPQRPIAMKAATDEPRTNLPAQLTSFVGREEQQQHLVDALTSARLVTLTGPGGDGKTRLAFEVASQLLESFEDGIWLVDLTGLSDPDLVPQTVAVTLNVPGTEGRSAIEALAEALAGTQMLLVLDNCEHLVSAAAGLADHVLRSCPSLHILATSREPLRVSGEVVWPVPALEVPNLQSLPAPRVLEQVEAVRLFIDRARLVRPDFALTPANAVAVATICQRLDGLPLAIELAAARIRSLPVDQLAHRLDAALPLLTGGTRPGPARHQSMQAAIAWSFDLLDDQEQRLLTRLAIFASGFTIEAAESICAGDLLPPDRILELLFQLADKSLVVVEDADGEMRYRLLETIRQFVRGRQEANSEHDDLRHRFRTWYLTLVERAEPELLGPGNGIWMRRLWSEIDNLRAAMDVGHDQNDLEQDLRFAAALWPFWVQSTLLSEGRRRLEPLLARNGLEAVPASLRARVLCGTGIIAQRQGDFGHAIGWTEDALHIWQSLDNAMGVAIAYNNLCTCALMRNDYDQTVAVCSESLSRSKAVDFGVGVVASLGSLGEAELMQGNLAQARDWLQQSVALAREMNFGPFITWMLASLGETARRDGDAETARRCLIESLEIGRLIRDALGPGRALRGLGFLALDAGDIDEANRLLIESLDTVWTLGYKVEIARALEALATVAIARSNASHAVMLLASADTLRVAIDSPMAPFDQYTVGPIVDAASTTLGESRFAAVWERGRAKKLSDTVAEALASSSG